MELVRGDQQNKRKNKQIRTINSANPISRIFLIFELMGEKITDYRNQRKGFDIDLKIESPEVKANNFKTFIISQGYMLSFVMLDLIINLTASILIVNLVWKIINIFMPIKELVEFRRNILLNWIMKFSDSLSSSVSPLSPFALKLASYLPNASNYAKYIENLFPVVFTLLAILFVGYILKKMVKNNIIELI